MTIDGPFRGLRTFEDFALSVYGADKADTVYVEGLNFSQQRALIDYARENFFAPPRIETEKVWPKDGEPYYNVRIHLSEMKRTPAFSD